MQNLRSHILHSRNSGCMLWEVNIITDIVQAYWWLFLCTKCQQMFFLTFFIYYLPTHLFPCLPTPFSLCACISLLTHVLLRVQPYQSHEPKSWPTCLQFGWQDWSAELRVIRLVWAMSTTEDGWHRESAVHAYMLHHTHTTAPIYTTARLENHHINVNMTMRSFSLDPEGAELISVIQRDD